MYTSLYEQFGFSALWTPFMLLFTVALAVLYALLIGKWRHRFKEAERVPYWKQALFYFGLLCLYTGSGSPLYIMGHFMFSIHMTQMALLYLLAPPLLIAGTPAWLFQPIKNRSKATIWFRRFTHPAVGLLAFNILFSFYHIPQIFDFIMTHVVIHNTYLFVLFLAAYSLWWTLLCPIDDWDIVSPLKKWGYIIASGVLLTPACALIIFANGPLYQTYTDMSTWLSVMKYCIPAGVEIPPEFFSGYPTLSPMTPLEDQKLGGVIMKILQELVLGISLGYVFFQWFESEKKRKPEEEYMLKMREKYSTE